MTKKYFVDSRWKTNGIQNQVNCEFSLRLLLPSSPTSTFFLNKWIEPVWEMADTILISVQSAHSIAPNEQRIRFFFIKTLTTDVFIRKASTFSNVQCLSLLKCVAGTYVICMHENGVKNVQTLHAQLESAFSNNNNCLLDYN